MAFLLTQKDVPHYLITFWTQVGNESLVQKALVSFIGELNLETKIHWGVIASGVSAGKAKR